MLALSTTSLLCFAPHSFSTPTIEIQPGVHLPLVGIGTWQYNESVAEAAVLSALGMGYEHVDTAAGYANAAGVTLHLPSGSYLPRTDTPGQHGASDIGQWATTAAAAAAAAAERACGWVAAWQRRTYWAASNPADTNTMSGLNSAASGSTTCWNAAR